MTGSILFWALAAAIAAACISAVLAPLRDRRQAQSRAESDIAVYRDQLAEVDRDLARGLIGEAEADSARTEITRRLLAADAARQAEGAARPISPRVVAAVLAVGIPLIALPLYLAGGSPGLRSQPFAERLARAPEDLSLAELVVRVEEHLRANPADAQGWRVVAPVYARMGRYADAADAYARLMALEGESAERLTDMGEALVFGDEGMVSERANGLFERAIALEAENPRARYFLGLAAVQSGDPQRARDIWQELAGADDDAGRWRQLAEQSLATLDDPSPERAIAALPPDDRAAAIEGMVEGLDARLAEDGGSVDEWLRLMQARMVLGQPEKAQDARTRALAEFADDDAATARIKAAADELGLADR